MFYFPLRTLLFQLDPETAQLDAWLTTCDTSLALARYLEDAYRRPSHAGSWDWISLIRLDWRPVWTKW